jgi:DNA-binding NtrC family response regulator
MTRVLVVHHDGDVADNEADYLRRAGYAVTQCSGPSFGPCPIHAGLACPIVEGADVLVYDVWAAGESDGGRSLVRGLAALHPGVPVVLTSAGMEPDWVAPAGTPGVVVLDGAAQGAQLVKAVEQALAMVARPG